MADEQKKEAQGSGEAPAEKKNKKIRFMSNAELDQAIEKTEKNQGGMNSKYAKELLKQKEFISNKK